MEKSRIEWVLYDSQTQKLELCTAKNQKEAIKEALRRNIVPRNLNHVRPRTSTTQKMMTEEEFKDFIDRITG